MKILVVTMSGRKYVTQCTADEFVRDYLPKVGVVGGYYSVTPLRGGPSDADR